MQVFLWEVRGECMVVLHANSGGILHRQPGGVPHSGKHGFQNKKR